MDERPSADGPLTERLTIPEAARALDITSEAVRGRVKRGTLRSERDPDGSVRVILETGRPTSDRAATDHQPTADRVADQSELVEQLRGEVEYLRGQLDQEREAGRRKDHLLAAALERIPELEASTSGQPERSETAPRSGAESPAEGETPSAPEKGTQRRGGWLRRILGR